MRYGIYIRLSPPLQSMAAALPSWKQAWTGGQSRKDGEYQGQLKPQCTMQKQVTFSKDWDCLARRASERKMHFLVLALKFGHQSAQGSPKQTCFRFRSQNQHSAITPKRKECPLILALCRLMIKFCYQYQKMHFLIRGSPWQAIPV